MNTDTETKITHLRKHLSEMMDHAYLRYTEEQANGDAVSIASTRGRYLALRDCRDLLNLHFPKKP